MTGDFDANLSDATGTVFDNMAEHPTLYVVFLACSALTTLIMTNALIAVMCNTYDRIQDAGTSSATSGRAQKIFELESVYGRQLVKQDYLIVIRPSESSKSGEWTGRTAAMRKDNQRAVEQQLSVQQAVDRLQQTVESQNAEISSIKEGLAALQNSMTQLLTQSRPSPSSNQAALTTGDGEDLLAGLLKMSRISLNWENGDNTSSQIALEC